MKRLGVKSLRGTFSASTKEVAVEQPTQREKKFSPVISVRVNREERKKLERDAAGMSLSAYVRERLLGDDLKPRKTRGKFPVKDQQALAQVLGRLGRSEIAAAVGALLLACEEERLSLNKNQEGALRSIESDLVFIRKHLIKALGLKAGSE